MTLQTLQSSRIALPSVQAASRFKSFRPSTEGPQPLRELQVVEDNLQRLRAKREMLKSMTPEQAFNAIEWHTTPMTMLEAISLAEETGKLIVPNSILDGILNKTKFRVPTVRTGTMIVYEAPGKPFGSSVIHIGLGFSVPEQFRRKTDCALVVEYPDFELVRLGRGNLQFVVPDERRLHLIEQISTQRSWHIPDCEFGIPCGTVTSESQAARNFWRLTSSYLGLLARDDNYDDGRQDVDASSRLSSRLGVALI